MTLSVESARFLAELERQMDRGEQPFVVHMDQRLAVMPEVMAELGLENGQTVSSPICDAIIRANMAVMGAQLATAEAVAHSKATQQ